MQIRLQSQIKTKFVQGNTKWYLHCSGLQYCHFQFLLLLSNMLQSWVVLLTVPHPQESKINAHLNQKKEKTTRTFISLSQRSNKKTQSNFLFCCKKTRFQCWNKINVYSLLLLLCNFKNHIHCMNNHVFVCFYNINKDQWLCVIF